MTARGKKMAVLGFSPCILISSFLTTLLLDRGVLANDSKQLPTSSPWYPSDPSSPPAKTSNEEAEALKRVLPLVSFDCRGKTGYFTDSKFSCEVFHYCQPDGSRNTFHCPPNKLFNQLSMLCEEKTAHNTRLCREGSISPSKLRPADMRQTQKRQKPKPSSGSNATREPLPKKMMSLEELLGYINGGNAGKQSEPTFISRFRTPPVAARESRNSTQSAIQTGDSNAGKKGTISTNISEAHLSAEGSVHSFSVSQVPTHSNKPEVVEDMSAEYEAIEGRKFRKAKRLQYTREMTGSEKPSARFSTDSPISVDGTVPSTESKNNVSPSLFTADRNKAKDYRKRKRYQGRKRKVHGATNDTEILSETPSTIREPSRTRDEVDALRSSANRRRKSQRTRNRENVLKGLQSPSESKAVEPYKLPPLPTPAEEIEATTEMHRIEDLPKERPRSKNPRYKSKEPPPEDENTRYGEKLPDLDHHHYQTDHKTAEGPTLPDYYEMKDTSQEVYSEKDPLYSKNPPANDERPKSMDNQRKPEADTHMYEMQPEKTMEEHDFPPARAEAREHHSTPPQQMVHESGSEKPKGTRMKATTEDPFRVTHPYIEKYKKLKEMEDQKWKAESEKDKKVAVGSTFFFEDDPPTDPTRPVPPIPTDTKLPEEDSQMEEIPKHLLAHQHLSKIMNDFFAMSSPNAPEQPQEVLVDQEEEDFMIPNYRIPEEDIYTGSESVAESVEEIPPELLEVVDLLAGQLDRERRGRKPKTSHEIIKINGPITDSQLEKIFLDDKFDEENEHEVSADGSYKKIVVVPQPEEKDDEMKEIAEVAEYTSLKLEPFLKQISGDKSVTVIPLKNEPESKRESVITAKKIPVRVIYRDQLKEESLLHRKPQQTKPSVKLWHSHWPTSRIQFVPNGRAIASKPMMLSSHANQQIILHPKSLFPPHPPPLPNKRLPFRVGYPFATNSRFLNLNTRTIHNRQKRSIDSRLRRQIRQNQHFLPFSNPVYPGFNPKFRPTFSPFRSLFRPAQFHASSSHLMPFTFPRYPMAKPTQNRPQIFRQNHPRPPPVRHVMQNGQTVIVEEVPIPIHVEVPSPNLIRSATSASHPPKMNTRYPGLRTPSPPAIQRPPLINRPQNMYLSTPGNQHFGMPSNARPPALGFQPPVSFASGLPPRITSEGKVYALGVTTKPLSMPKPIPPQPYKANTPRIPPRPFNPFEIHPSSYPHFPYIQGAFTTPITNEPVPGRVMYSGYKPPKSTLGTKPPKSSSNKERKTSESKSNRSRSKPSQDYLEIPPKPIRDSHVSYTEEVMSKERTRPKPIAHEYPLDHANLQTPTQSLTTEKSEETKPRKRRPGRRRRPRPHSATQGPSTTNDISPTPPPPEQIPPPPADYTSKPAHIEHHKSFPSHNDGSKSQETSSHFPPAGYYGKDQLIQFFDSSSKSHKKSTTPKPHEYNDLSGHTSSVEHDESFTSASGEDGSQPAFGTRLRANTNKSKNRQPKVKQQKQSQSRNTEVRTHPPETMNRYTNQPNENINPDKRFKQTRPNEGSRPQIRNENQNPQRRRPQQPRQRNRVPPAMATPQTQVHHFNYNQNLGNFYSVPNGLQTLVAPEKNLHQGFGGSTDMFGLPHPIIDQSIYSHRPQEAPVDFNPNFFSVPAHVAQQQQSPLHQRNIQSMPESAREFFEAALKESSKIPEATTKEPEPNTSSKPREESGENKSPAPVRKLRKPKRKHRYNPHSNEHRDSAEASIAKPQNEQTTTTREGNPIRYKDRSTTVVTTTTPEKYATSAFTFHNDKKEAPAAFKHRTPLLPKTLPEISKSLLNGKVDYQKLNATISTSVSVSGNANLHNTTSSEEKENKKVFSSQNGGLAVMKKGPKRKRARQRVSTTTGVPYINNNINNADAKYEIASSVLDIIKATTETERQASGYYNAGENAAASKVSNIWVESKRTK